MAVKKVPKAKMATKGKNGANKQRTPQRDIVALLRYVIHTPKVYKEVTAEANLPTDHPRYSPLDITNLFYPLLFSI